MTNVHAPTSEAEAAAIIEDARAAKTTLAIEGGGTRRGLGRSTRPDAILSTRALTGVTLYEPAEMVIAARAGTPLAEVERVLAAKGQMLPFEPMDSRPLHGSSGEPTIGAVAACNISGPRRVQVGAARDHMIGARLANGRGEIVKSGGRVMKNVTGLDLVKLVCGAHGTLGLLTEVTFKVLPRPRATGTLGIDGLDDARAVECMCAALGSPFEVSAAAHLPRGMTGDVARTYLRIEHFPESVDYRLGALATLAARFGAAERLDETASLALWADIRDARPIAEPIADAVWRVCVAPTRAARVIETLRETVARRWFYDWGGGLAWVATAAEGDCGAAAIRAALAATGGHATLVRAPEEIRGRVDVFQPLSESLMILTRGIKTSFDPDGVLEPGRMYAGM